MGKVQTVIYRDALDADRRLEELSLTRKGLMKVAAVAIHEAANVTPFHCANASGTFAYHHGSWALRQVFVGSEWVPVRFEGIEAIRNAKLNIRVAYSNVDVACNDFQAPKPRSKKGAGAERACIGNLFEDLPSYAPQQKFGLATYYLMVDENGATELTMPVVSNGTFSSCIERIYLSDGSDFDSELLHLDNGEIADHFDPQIIRKK